MRKAELVGVYNIKKEAEAFDRFASRVSSFEHARFARHVSKHCATNSSILDVGAGGGHLAMEMVRIDESCRVVALDASAHMLGMTWQRAQTSGVEDRVDCVRARAESLPFDDNSFDLVVSHFVLHEIEDYERAVNEMSRVVKPGGAVVIRDIVRPPEIMFKVIPKRIMSFNKELALQSWDSWFSALTLNEFRSLKDKLGGDNHIRLGYLRAILTHIPSS